jgi:hypothetical protein
VHPIVRKDGTLSIQEFTQMLVRDKFPSLAMAEKLIELIGFIANVVFSADLAEKLK